MHILNADAEAKWSRLVACAILTNHGPLAFSSTVVNFKGSWPTYENGLKGYEKVGQGRVDEEQEPKATAVRA